jgi:hypothetical protein
MFLDIVAALLALGMAAAWVLTGRSFRPIGRYEQAAQAKLPDAGHTP